MTKRKEFIGDKDSYSFTPHPSTKKAWLESKKNKKRGTN